jgi:fatty acid desaturase
LIVFPTLFTLLISGLRPHIEHAGTGQERFSQARSWISPTFDLVYGGINYHLAHHLYPAVPAYHIRRLHRWLSETGQLPAAGVHEIRSWAEYWEVVIKA